VEIRFEKRKPVRVAFVQHVGPYQECGAAWQKLLTFAARHDLFTPETLRIGIGHDNPDVPPLADLADYHVAVTTPYILTQSTKADWTAYVNRAMLDLEAKDDGQRLYELLKYRSWTHQWNEFVFLAYRHHQYDAIFLAGIPDVKGSLLYAKLGRT